MSSVTPCKFCGCSQTNLMDGFYYCAECGTQDTNVRETIIEVVTFADGEIAKAGRKSLKHAPKAEVEMPDDWYKWHTLNFLLKGLADEIIAAGAQPSFKTKLLWIWTRYMDKYQNKADFGISTTEEAQNDEEEVNDKTDKFSDDEDDDDDPSERLWLSPKLQDIKRISMPLVVSMLYVALNLDKSHIQLGQLLRLMKQGKVSIVGWQKLIPKELRPKKLKNVLFFKYKCFIFTFDTIRVLTVSIFRDLDLGNPIVPDLRVILDNYVQELCLPNDIKPLVVSLMYARSFDYLDVNIQYKDIRKIPLYELYVMGHILMALKICFGLDSDYEFELSDIVDKINEQENYHKCYINRKCESERLFCFRDWCGFMRFRRTMLWTHTLHLGAPNMMDTNDYVAMEHLAEKPDYKYSLKEEITAELLRKLPDVDLDVIPRDDFPTTITPHTAYTKIILDHIQDPEVKTLLSEDFTQYSLKYITEDMLLVDPDSWNPKNLLNGVSSHNKIETNKKFLITIPTIKGTKKNKIKVFVKDCDNHNWMITQRPNLEHVNDEDDGNEKNLENSIETVNKTLDNTADCNKTSKDSSKVILDTTVEMDSKNDSKLSVDSNMNETEMKNNTIHEEMKVLTIREEDEGVNIFDDDFIDLEAKKEEVEEPECNEEEINFDNIDFSTLRYEDECVGKGNDVNSDASSEDSLHMNPDSLNRDEAIKELVIHACQKYKISIPGIYMTRVRKKANGTMKPGLRPRLHHGLGEVKQKIQGFMAEYRNLIENDLFHQMASKVQSAIAEFNRTKDEIEDERPPSEKGLDNADQTMDSQKIENTEDNLDKTIPESIKNDTIKEDEYKLFGDSSDGETHAEELLPKKNPDYDEETHDIRQLYLKQDKDIDFPEMELNPKLQKIVERKIKEEMENPKSLEIEETEETDSEEELPLNVLIEQRNLRKQMVEQEKLAAKLPPLIKNDRIPQCLYWIKLYYIKNEKDIKRPFSKEVDTFPRSFAFVLNECADVAGYEPYSVYKALMNVERFLTITNKFDSIKRPAEKNFTNSAKKMRRSFY